MALPVRKGYTGNGVSTTLTSSPTAGDTTFTVAAVTGWPASYPFYVVVDPGTSKEEKMRVTGVSSLTVTVVRGQDDTTAVGHSSGATVYPVFTADEADEANRVASAMTTKGDLITTDGSDINRLAVGTNAHVLQADSAVTNGVKWGQVATAGIADSAVTEAKIATGAVTSTKIADGTIVLGDLATALQAFLVPVGTITAYGGSTAPTGWLLCDGTAISGSYTSLIALVGANTPDLRGRFPMGKTASGTGSTLLGTGGSNTIAEGNLPAHTHGVGTLDIQTGGAHNHTGTVDAAGSHNHTGTVDAAGGHSHGAGSYSVSHNHGLDGKQTSSTSHTHTGVSTVAMGISGGGDVFFFTDTEAPAVTGSSSAVGDHQHTFTASTVGNHQHTFTTGTFAAHDHGITGSTASVGSGTAYFQPFVAVNYIIKHD